MSDDPNLEENFIKVTYKSKGKRSRNKIQLQHKHISETEDADFNKIVAIRRIEEAKSELLNTDFYDSVSASLREGLKALNVGNIDEIVCLGLGRIGECIISRYQFALLLCVRDVYGTNISVYDPAFGSSEKILLEHYSCIVLQDNVEGKYKVNNKFTLFYLPHCPKQLSNNLLWSNWGLTLSYCVIISNSFNKIIENTSNRELEKNGQFITNISPYTLEIGIVNTFKFFEIFNDLAIHVFPWENLNLISEDFWKSPVEPHYSDEDIEFIRK